MAGDIGICWAQRFWSWDRLAMVMIAQVEKHDQRYGDGNPKDKTTETLETRRHPNPGPAGPQPRLRFKLMGL